jgi:hypothetical protein
MERKCLRIVLIVLGMFVAASAIAAQAKAPNIYRFSGLGAGAYFFNVDESGCIFTNIFVEFGRQASGSPRKPSQQPALAYMYIVRWDMCSGAYMSAQTNPPPILPEGAVQVAPSLKSASLNAPFELLDDSTGSTFTADVSITWTATGVFQRSNNHDHYKAEWGFFNANTRSISRDASVVGSVLVDGVNLTSSPWTGPAWIEEEIEGSILIFKKP